MIKDNHAQQQKRSWHYPTHTLHCCIAHLILAVLNRLRGLYLKLVHPGGVGGSLHSYVREQPLEESSLGLLHLLSRAGTGRLYTLLEGGGGEGRRERERRERGGRGEEGKGEA